MSEYEEFVLPSLIVASPGSEDPANEEVEEREQHGSPSIEESPCYRRLRDRRIADSEPFKVLKVYVAHYMKERPDRGLGLAVPAGDRAPQIRWTIRTLVERRDVLGGLIHEYRWAA